ncbi:MAG TPA: hypothetical protein VIS48_05970 [Candidatus Kryptonia bacterium]
MGDQAEEEKQGGQVAKTRAELQQEFMNDLQTNERYKAFFEQYTSHSVESFIESYASLKCDIIEYGKASYKREEGNAEDEETTAATYLWQIQQRKLFDLQCRWRAGLIDLPEIETIWDFDYWGDMIQACPFIPPITQEEFNLYLDYIMSDYFEPRTFYYHNWQNYDTFKALADDDEWEGYPQWYEYYERFAGPADWRLLPDVRGERDHEYFHLGVWEGCESVSHAPADNRPILGTWDEDLLEEFIRKFESPEVLRYMQAWNRKRDLDEDDDLEMAVYTLQHTEEHVPMEFNENWRDAIMAAARLARQLEITKRCKRAYEEYLRREELGLCHELLQDEKDVKTHEKSRSYYLEMVRKGRELKGDKSKDM